MAPIYQQHQMDSHHHAHHGGAWEDNRQARPGTHYPQHQHHHQQHQHQWPSQGQLHITPGIRDEGFAPSPSIQHGSLPNSRQHHHHQPHSSATTGRDVLGEGSFMGRGYSIKRCQGFVRCDMDIDAEVVGWVIGKNGSTIKDMKHKTGCNMWVDQRALKLTITGPDLASVEHAAKSVDAYVAAAPIKAGAVEAAMTKTLECPPQLLDDLGDRTTIARIVKETHAQVVVNKKIGRIIVRGDPRSVDLAYASVQAMIRNAVNGGFGLGVRINAADGHHGAYGGGTGYLPELSTASRGGGGGGGVRSPLISVGEPSQAGGMHHMMLHPSGRDPSPRGPDFHGHPTTSGGNDASEFRNVTAWAAEPHMLELKPELPHQQQPHQPRSRVGGSDTDESEVETVSLASICARSSTGGSPRVPGSYNTSPALSGTASTPIGDWSLFSGGFGLGMAALQEGESSSRASTPPTARTTPRVHFPENLRALGSDGLVHRPVLLNSGRSSPPNDGGDALDSGNGSSSGSATGTGTKSKGSLAPPPSPASTTGGEASRKMLGLAVPEAQVLRALDGADEDDEDGEGTEDISDKVARLGNILQSMGLGKYCPKFAENEVDLEALGLMSENDLKDIGIPKGPRLKILNAVGARAVSGVAHAPAV